MYKFTIDITRPVCSFTAEGETPMEAFFNAVQHLVDKFPNQCEHICVHLNKIPGKTK